jgi:two-component system LytT family response regulator
MRCIAIDDEELALELLEDNIRKLPYLELAGKFTNPLEALRFVQDGSVDLIFLDIQMPGMTGLQFIQSFPEKCMFILITAYENYALQGFNLNVIDYLLKPVPFERFVKACNKALELYQLRSKKDHGGEGKPSYFFVNVDYSLQKISFPDLVYVEGLKDYLKLHLKSSQKPIISRMTIKAIEEELPESQFLRIHKSFIVSKESITSVRKNSVFLGTMELPVGDSYKDRVNAFVQKND